MEKKKERNLVWYDPNDEQLMAAIAEKRERDEDCKNSPNDQEKIDAYKVAWKKINKRCTELRAAHWSVVANELQTLADKDRMGRQFYDACRRKYGLSKGGATQLPDTMLKKGSKREETKAGEETDIRMREHFDELLNQKENVTIRATTPLPAQSPVQEWMDLPFKVVDAIQGLLPDKAIALDDKLTEVYKTARSNTDWLAEFVELDQGEAPAVFKDIILVPLFKSGDNKDLNNYRGIALFNAQAKILEKLKQIRIVTFVEVVPGCIPAGQFGFMKGRSTVDASFLSRQIAVDAIAKNVEAHKCYVDLVKAYDTVVRSILWKVLEKRGGATEISSTAHQPTYESKGICASEWEILGAV